MKSLRRRYLMASVGLIGALLITVFLAYWHLGKVTNHNSRALELTARVSATLDRVPEALRQADQALQDLLAEPSLYRDSPLARHLSAAYAEVAVLAHDPALAGVAWHPQLDLLEKRLAALADACDRLLAQYTKPGWLYPALPLIAGTMYDSNTALDTGLETALAETSKRLDTPERRDLYRELVTLRDLWRRITLDFRAAMIRFAGLPSGTLRDDNALRELYRSIQAKLAHLESQRALWQDSFETAEIIPELRPLAAAWFADYYRVRELQASGHWRGDLQYVTQVLRPLQRQASQQLLAVKQAVSTWRSGNVDAVRDAAADINHLVWVLAALALASLLINYLILDRGLLRPLAEVSEALAAQGDGDQTVILPSSRYQEVTRLVSAFKSMRAQIDARQRALEHQALHDELTGLPNRALLRDRLSHGLRTIERSGSSLGLLLLDLNSFKEINDTLGHHAGDQVLVEVARRLLGLLRDSDTVARLGGDEFAVVLPGLDRGGATDLARRIASSLHQPFALAEQLLHLGASVGVVVAPEDGRDPTTLLRRADNAMYSAKRSGRDYAFYDADEDRATTEGLRLATRLRAALNGEPGLALRYQPRLSLADDRLTCVEALLEWQDPMGRATSSQQILRTAEHANLSRELTAWILDRALADCANSRDHGLRLSVAVNLSPHNLADDELADLVQAGLRRHDLPATRLTLEIAETAVMGEPTRAKRQLDALAAMGVKLAIDDFGTGFSSLAHLSQLPVHELKIHRSLVSGMTSNNNSGLIVHAIIELAHNLGLQVVAEGVERRDTLTQLRADGCDAVQGRLVSPPLSLTELHELFSEQTRKREG